MAMDILVNTVSGNGLVPSGANVDLSSVRSRGMNQRTLSPEDLKIPISKARLKITFLKSHYDPPGANEWNVADAKGSPISVCGVENDLQNPPLDTIHRQMSKLVFT